MKIRFGNLQPQLASACRYWNKIRQVDGTMANKLLTASEYTHAVSKVLPTQGTAEVMAQAGSGGNRSGAWGRGPTGGWEEEKEKEDEEKEEELGGGNGDE